MRGTSLAPRVGMANSAQAVTVFMSTPVHTIAEDAPVRQAERRMAALGVSSLAVIDSTASLTGVITSTDLLASGLRNAGRRPDAILLQSAGKVSSVMTPKIISVEIDASVADAAALMVSSHVHRVFVMARGDIAGVLSTSDIMAAVEAVRVRAPVSQFMSTPVFTVRATESVSLATERLEKAHVTGLIVVDESGWPVGVFGQQEALEAGDVSRSSPVETAMNAAVLTIPDRSAVHNAARQALAMNARRVAVMNRHELVGIMTGVDFAKAMA